MKKWLLPLVILPLFVAACDQKTQSAQADEWLGHWTGVEGTYLDLARNDDTGGYTVTIADLDGPRTFDAKSNADGIAFDRDGKTLIIKSGNGEDTGMKWLADKQNCLVVDSNEGYCRD